MTNLSDSIPNRIRALRQERGWSLQTLATRAGTTAPQVMRIEKSTRQLTTDWIERFAKAFDISPAELAFAGSTISVANLPLIGRIQAGNWQEAVELSDETIPVPTNIAGGSTRAFALRVTGTSMNMLAPDGSIVVVDPDDADLLDGKVYAVMNGSGETTVKRYRASPARLEPVSSDPEHQPIMLGREPFVVVGRVLEALTIL